MDKEKNISVVEKANEEIPQKKEKWGSNLEFILTCLSYVIGFGNIWRFPYICYKNGGGAFLIPYFLSLLFLGLPLMLVEMTLGQYSAKGKVIVWNFMPIFFGVGISMMIVVTTQAVYYCMLLSWSLYYFFASFTLNDLPWKECGHAWNTWRCTNGSLNESYKSPSDEYLHENVLQINHDMEDISTLNWKLVGCLVISWIFVFIALWNGVKSLGKVSYFTTIFPFLCLLILFVRGITLEGAMDGIKFYIIPDFKKLLELTVWIDASQQIFFSLGIAWGMIITMSSYNDFSNHLIRDAIIIAFGNSFTSIFAGFVIFSFMGSVAHERNVTITNVAVDGPGLAFMIYPEAVGKFPFGQLFSAIFFFMLILLGLGSQTPSIESVMATIYDYFPSKRKTRPMILFVICFVGLAAGLIYCTQAGMYWFVLFNDFCASTSAMIIGLTEVVAVSWVYGVDKFVDHIKEMVGRTPQPRILWIVIFKYITPLYLTVIILATIYTTEEPTYGGYKFPKWTILLGWFINFGSVLPIPIVAAYYLFKCYSKKEISFKDVSNPNVDWKTKDSDSETSKTDSKEGLKDDSKNDSKVEPKMNSKDIKTEIESNDTKV